MIFCCFPSVFFFFLFVFLVFLLSCFRALFKLYDCDDYAGIPGNEA